MYGFEKVKIDKITKTIENLSWVGLLMPSQNIKIVGTDQKGSKIILPAPPVLICLRQGTETAVWKRLCNTGRLASLLGRHGSFPQKVSADFN